MDPIAFSFQVNNSFKDYSSPITIPKVYHGKLRKNKLDESRYRIVWPKGEILRATMNHGRPGMAKEYYQLTVPTQDHESPNYLNVNDKLIVILVRHYKNNYAILEWVK